LSLYLEHQPPEVVEFAPPLPDAAPALPVPVFPVPVLPPPAFPVPVFPVPVFPVPVFPVPVLPVLVLPAVPPVPVLPVPVLPVPDVNPGPFGLDPRGPWKPVPLEGDRATAREIPAATSNRPTTETMRALRPLQRG